MNVHAVRAVRVRRRSGTARHSLNARVNAGKRKFPQTVTYTRLRNVRSAGGRRRRRRREVRSYLVCACCTAALANRGLGERESAARQGRVAVTARDIPIVLVGWRGQVR